MCFAAGGASAAAAKSAEAPRTTAAGRGSRREASSDDSRRVTTSGASPDAARSARTEAGRRGGSGSAPPGGGIAPEEARATEARRRPGRATRATRRSRNLPSTSAPTRREHETRREGIETTRRDVAGARGRETTAAGAKAVVSDIVCEGARAPGRPALCTGCARRHIHAPNWATRFGWDPKSRLENPREPRTGRRACKTPACVETRGRASLALRAAFSRHLVKVGRPDDCGVIASDVRSFRLGARASTRRRTWAPSLPAHPR